MNKLSLEEADSHTGVDSTVWYVIQKGFPGPRRGADRPCAGGISVGSGTAAPHYCVWADTSDAG